MWFAHPSSQLICQLKMKFLRRSMMLLNEITVFDFERVCFPFSCAKAAKSDCVAFDQIVHDLSDTFHWESCNVFRLVAVIHYQVWARIWKKKVSHESRVLHEPRHFLVIEISLTDIQFVSWLCLSVRFEKLFELIGSRLGWRERVWVLLWSELCVGWDKFKYILNYNLN